MVFLRGKPRGTPPFWGSDSKTTTRPHIGVCLFFCFTSPSPPKWQFFLEFSFELPNKNGHPEKRSLALRRSPSKSAALRQGGAQYSARRLRLALRQGAIWGLRKLFLGFPKAIWFQKGFVQFSVVKGGGYPFEPTLRQQSQDSPVTFGPQFCLAVPMWWTSCFFLFSGVFPASHPMYHGPLDQPPRRSGSHPSVAREVLTRI